jgi:hypothetical protein
MKLTEVKLKQLIVETINETIFVDDKGRAVDLTGDRGSPEDRRYFEKLKILDHPNKEFRDKVKKLQHRTNGFGFDAEGYMQPISQEEKEKAQKEFDFLVDMSHHPNKKIRSLFNSEAIEDVNQAISIGEVDDFAPPKYTPPPMTDDEQYEQGIYDDFDTPGGYGEHNYPGRHSSAEANRDYSREYDVIKKRMEAAVYEEVFNPSRTERASWNDAARVARKTPGWRQIMDKLQDSRNIWIHEFETMIDDVLSKFF